MSFQKFSFSPPTPHHIKYCSFLLLFTMTKNLNLNTKDIFTIRSDCLWMPKIARPTGRYFKRVSINSEPSRIRGLHIVVINFSLRDFTFLISKGKNAWQFWLWTLSITTHSWPLSSWTVKRIEMCVKLQQILHYSTNDGGLEFYKRSFNKEKWFFGRGKDEKKEEKSILMIRRKLKKEKKRRKKLLKEKARK